MRTGSQVSAQHPGPIASFVSPEEEGGEPVYSFCNSLTCGPLPKTCWAGLGCYLRVVL